MNIRMLVVVVILVGSVSFARDKDSVGPNGGAVGTVEVIDVYGSAAEVKINGDAAKALFELLSKKNHVSEEQAGNVTIKGVKGSVANCMANLGTANGEKYEIWTCSLGVNSNGDVNDGYSIPKGGGSVHN